MTSPVIVPLVVAPVVDRCDECGTDLTNRHRARCACCGAELCTDCDLSIAWDYRLNPAGPSLCGWCYPGHDDEPQAA